MSKLIVLVDYGVGNLFSVRSALDAVGAEVTQSADPKVIANAERIIVPGVGAFGHCMERLKQLGLVEVLQDFSRSGRPMLGICVGMQLLLDSSEEYGDHEGLGLIKGRVKKIHSTTIDNVPHKIPHIGWNGISASSKGKWERTLLAETENNSFFYFVHSYSAVLDENENLLASTFYNGRQISAAIQKGNIFGVQFHPEKSGLNGLSVIRQFVNL